MLYLLHINRIVIFRTVMDAISQSLSNLETVELQILGSLFKIKTNKVDEAVSDLERTAKRFQLKAKVKSV